MADNTFEQRFQGEPQGEAPYEKFRREQGLPEEEARSYEPTWRDKLATAVGGGTNYETQRLSERVLGSSGIGTEQGVSAIDFAPGVGGALRAQEDYQHGNYPQMGADIATAVIPGAGAIANTLMPLVKPLTRVGLSTLAAAGAGMGSTIAATMAEAAETKGFTKEQLETLRRTPKADRQALMDKFRSEATQERIRQEGVASQKANEQAILQTLTPAEQSLFLASTPEQRQSMLNKIAEKKQAEEESKKPFFERYKALANILPTLSVAAAGALPYAVRARAVAVSNQYMKEWAAHVTEANKHLSAGNLQAAMPHVNTLKAYQAEHEAVLGAMKPSGVGLAATAGIGATIPFDVGFLIPNAIDSLFLPKGSEGQKQAWENLTNPEEWGKRFPTALAEGLTPALTGAKVPTRVRPSTAPTAGAKGSIDTAAQMSAPAKKTRAPRKPKAEAPVQQAPAFNPSTQASKYLNTL